MLLYNIHSRMRDINAEWAYERAGRVGQVGLLGMLDHPNILLL